MSTRLGGSFNSFGQNFHGSSFTWMALLKLKFYDAPLNSLLDSTASLNVKIMEG
jgi:hypothetical protein